MTIYAYSYSRNQGRRLPRGNQDHKFLEGDGRRFEREVMFNERSYELEGLSIPNLRGYEELV